MLEAEGGGRTLLGVLAFIDRESKDILESREMINRERNGSKAYKMPWVCLYGFGVLYIFIYN